MLSQVASSVRGEGVADGVERSASVVAGADQIGPDPTMSPFQLADDRGLWRHGVVSLK